MAQSQEEVHHIFRLKMLKNRTKTTTNAISIW